MSDTQCTGKVKEMSRLTRELKGLNELLGRVGARRRDMGEVLDGEWDLDADLRVRIKVVCEDMREQSDRLRKQGRTAAAGMLDVYARFLEGAA